MRMEDLKFHLTCPRSEKANLSFFFLDGLGTNIQWDNLTHLTLRCIFEDSFLILRTTPDWCFVKFQLTAGNIKVQEHLFFHHWEICSCRPGSQAWVELSEIEHITGVFLDNIIAPYLEEFSFPNYYTRSMRPMEANTSFLRRSACSLLSLSICFSNYRPFFWNLYESFTINAFTEHIITTIGNDPHLPWVCLPWWLWPMEHIATSGQGPLLTEYISSTRIFTKPQDFGIYRKA